MSDIVTILSLFTDLDTGLISLILQIVCWLNDLFGSPLDLGSICES